MKRTIPDDLEDSDTEIDHDKDEENYQKRDQEWESLLQIYSRRFNDGRVPPLLFPLRFFPYTLRFSDDPEAIWSHYIEYPRYILHRLALLKVSILETSALNISYKECKNKCFSEFSHPKYIHPQFVDSFKNCSSLTVDGNKIIASFLKENESASISLVSTSSSTLLANFRRRLVDNSLIVGLSRAPWSTLPGPTVTLNENEQKLFQQTMEKGNHFVISESLSTSDSSSASSMSIDSSAAEPKVNDQLHHEGNTSSASSSSSSNVSPSPTSFDFMNNEELISLGLFYESKGCYTLSSMVWHLLRDRGHHYGYYKIGVRYLYGWNVRRCIDTAIYLFECSALASASITPGLVYFLYTRHIDRLCSAASDGPRLHFQSGLMIQYLISEMIKSSNLSNSDKTKGYSGPLKITSLGELCRIPTVTVRYDADIIALLMYFLFRHKAPSSHPQQDSFEIRRQATNNLLQICSSPRSHPISAFILAFDVYGNSVGFLYNVSECIRYYKHASDGGLVEAATLLGRLYEVGYVDQIYNDRFNPIKKSEFPVDLKQSYYYYQLALQRGDVDSEEYLKRIRDKIGTCGECDE